MRNKLYKLSLLIVAIVVQVSMTVKPLSVVAFSEDGITLNIETTTIEVSNAWAQIRNAAIIHLISQKMQKCIQIGQVILNASDTGILGGTVWPRESRLGMRGVLDKGNVFKTVAALSGDIDTDVSAGAWLASFFGNHDGIIECDDYNSKGNLFDMFVYVYKNYTAGMTASKLEDSSASVTEADRLKVVCNKDDPTKPGLLVPSNWYGTPDNTACNSSSVTWYTGVSITVQEAYIKTLYEEMQERSNNKYLKAISWENLKYYNGVEGYYLYSNDFEEQCGSSSFRNKEGSESGYVYKSGYKVKSDGTIRSGYYEIDTTKDKAVESFVTKPKTCQDLVDEMNEHIKEYVQFVNHEVYKICSSGIDAAIDDKRREIQEKYIDNPNSTDGELKDANAVLGEYTRIQDEKEYVATVKDEEETLIKVSNDSESSMPTDYIWTCRSHLPFINVEVQDEDPLKDVLEAEFTDYCYKTMDLAWITCPIIRGVSWAVDGLSKVIDGFF